MRKELPQVTLCCVDCNTYGMAVSALKRSLQQIKPARTIFLTDIDLKIDSIETIQIPTIRSKREYSQFCLKELYKYFDTDFVLLVQNDGWVICGDSWDPEFLEFDFIGSPWLYQDGRNVGNGGVSLRSRRLQNILGTNEFIETFDPEDEVIGRLYRRYLEEKYDIKYPSEDLADHFSFELRTPIYKTFAFHSYFHKPYQPTVIIKRSAAMGDVVACEPVLRYFHDKGYRVVLDTLPQFHLLFINHYFKVHSLQEIDQRLLQTATFINFEMAYEVKPDQLHLKSYFEFANISEEEYLPYLETPKLSVGFQVTKETKLFEKYALFHVDNRAQPHRNVYGVNWEEVVQYVQSLGYTAIQVGRDDKAIIKGATRINCTNENFLAYVCAGADMMVGIDSGISNICAAFKVPCAILFGSVNPLYIHPEINNKVFIHNHDKKVCEKAFCWSSVIGCEGVDCYISKDTPPCTQFSTKQVFDAIKTLHESN